MIAKKSRPVVPCFPNGLPLPFFCSWGSLECPNVSRAVARKSREVQQGLLAASECVPSPPQPPFRERAGRGEGHFFIHRSSLPALREPGPFPTVASAPDGGRDGAMLASSVCVDPPPWPVSWHVLHLGLSLPRFLFTAVFFLNGHPERNSLDRRRLAVMPL